MVPVPDPRVRAPQAAQWVLSRGLSALTTAQVGELLGAPSSQVPQRLASAVRRGEWVCPARGLWVPVPPEYQGWAGPPALEFVAALMNHLGQPDYYVGWLTAAALYGAAHHAPQITQVAVSRAIRQRTVGRARLRFLTRSNLAGVPVVEHMARSGAVRVSSAEATLLDLAADLAEGGGIDNVANIVAQMADARDIDVAAAVRLAGSRPLAAARRLGWLLENFTNVGGLDQLARRVANTGPWSLLDSLSVARGSVDRRWNVKVNATVEVEA